MKKRVLSLFLAITLCLTLTPTGALAAEGQPPEQTVSVTQEAQIPAPAAEEEEEEKKTTSAENGADENDPPANPEENPTENAPAAAEKNTEDKGTGKEAGQNKPTAEGENEPLTLGLGDAAQNAADGENGEGSGGTHYVAEIGGTQYETVQEILDNEEGEITLLDSVKEDLDVYAATTIHMNGHSITGNIDATDSLTLNGGTVDGTVTVDATGGTFTMTAPAEAKAAITGGLNVVSGSAFVSGAQVGVKGTLYFDGTDMLISGAVKAVELDSAAEPAAKTLYGSATVNGDTAAEAGFDTDTYKVGGEIAKKLTNKQVGSTTPAAPSLTLTETSKSLTAGKTAVFTANYTGTDTLNAYVQGSAVNGYFTISQKNNGDGTYTVSVKIDEETPGGTYTLFVHEVGNTSVQASATITVTGLPDAAEVNGKQYKSLPRALNAARDGDTVKLLANHVTDKDALNALGEDFTFKQYASIVPVVTKTLTLDLNHKTVDYLEVGFTETNEETQKKETLATGNLTVTGEGAYGRISNLMFMAGALNIRSGEIGGSEGAGLFCDANSGSVTVSNGTVYGLTVFEGASVTVNGGSNHAGAWVVASGATLNITDGMFGDVQFTRNGTIAISGGTFQSIKSDIAEELQPLMSLLDTQKVHAFYKGDNVQDGNATELFDVTVKEHTHTMVNNKCACGFSCTHTNTEGASTIDKDGKCTVCGTQFAAGIGETYYTDVPSALDAATDGQTVKLLANAMLPDGIYVSKTLTLDLDGHSLSGYSLNVGGRTATGNLTVIDSSGGNGAVGVTVRDGGTLVFDPKNDHTTLLQLEVWGGTAELYGGKILRKGLRLNNGITLGNLLPQKAWLAYYCGDTQLTLEEAASKTCDLVVKSCTHGGKNGFDENATACPYCNAPAVAETALNHGDGSRPQRRFADLQTALDADRDGGAELTLLADVTGDYTIDGTQDTGLNLNGHCIKGTVTVKAAAGSNTTTLSNTKNTTTVSIDKVVAHKGAKLAGSKYPAVIGTLTLADTTKWKDILQQPTRLGFRVTSADGTYKWYAPNDVKGSQLNNVIINSLPITTKTLNLKVDGKNLTGNSPKVERGTTVQLCAGCNAKGADVYIYTGEIVGNNVPTYSQKKAEYKKIGTNWYYVVDLPCNTIGKYSVYFTATKDGYTVQSAEKKLTVTKPNLSNAEITFPDGNVAAFNYVTATGVPTFVVTYKGRTLEKDKDFTITGGGSTYDVGPCTLTIKATDNGDYTGSKSAQWNVRPLKVAASVGDIIKTYDGTKNLPANAKITFKSADSYYTGTTLRLAKGTDYEVSNACYDSPDAGIKTVSFTIKLKNAGYVFEDGTTQKDFTLNGAELGDKIKINKATVPMNNPAGTLNIINGTCQTYTYDFNNILPGLSEGKYGTISYGQADISLVSQSGYYYDETIVEFKKGKLILAQFYAKDGKMTGQIGTVKVKVTTTNYADFQLKLVLNAVDQIKPEPDGTITATPITYGDTLSKSEISGKMKDPNTGAKVEGTFSWQQPDNTILDASTLGHSVEWTFTPAAGYEKYATATGTVTIKVNKATPTFTAPTAQENLTYTGQEQALITAGMTDHGTMQYSLTENGTYSQDIPTGTDAGAYTVWYRVFGDANHKDTAPASVPVRIGQKPLTITGVTAASKSYDGTTNADITSVTFDGVTLNRGTDYTVTANFDDAGVGSGKNITATVTLMGQAAKNYALEQSSFPATGSITAKKVTVAITPNGGTYGSVVAAAAELSGAVAGENIPVTLTYTGNGYDATAVPVNVGSYTVTASIANRNYTLTGNTTAAFVIAPKAVTVSGITAKDKVYDGTTNATLDCSNAKFGGVLENDTLTVTAKGMFEKVEAGKQNVTISDLKLSGNSANNYVLAESSNQTETIATITAKKVTVTPDNKSKVYEENDPKLTYKVSGVLDGETLKGITLARAEGENAGEYDITGTAASANPNYDVKFVKGTFTIEPKSIQSATVVLGKGLAANGAEQTQTVAKVLLVNKELPADSYTVTGNTATAHGIYTLTITAKGNYTDSIAWTYVIAPSKAEDAPGEEITIGSGKVKVDVKSEGAVPSVGLLTDKAELLAMLVNSGDITADELVQIANGASVDIVLTVKEANVRDEVKTAMAQAAKDYTIGQYLDISLFKYMTVNGNRQPGAALHTTKNALPISVAVPDALIHTDSAVNRNYCIVRCHEGAIAVLDAAFDAANKTLTFKTDRFSIYAIAYKDTAVPSSSSSKPSSNNSSNDSETKKNEVAAPTPVPTPASTSKPSTITAVPQTGDTSNPTLYVVLLVASLLGLAVVFVCKKRNDK